MINNVQLKNTETTIFLAAAEQTFAVLSIIFCNVTTTDQTLTLFAYPTGKTASNATTIMKNLVIPPEDTFIWDANEKLILSPGDKISCIAAVSDAITATYNGMEL